MAQAHRFGDRPAPSDAVRNSFAEQTLDEQGVGYSLILDLNLHQIDVAESLRNQARFEPVDKERVARYTEDVQKGHRFPAIVVIKDPHAKAAKYTVIDGNHRMLAHQEGGRETIAAYVVDPSTPISVVQILAYVLNVGHGLPLKPEERLSHAAQAVDLGNPKKTVARMFGVKMGALTMYLDERDADLRRANLGVSAAKWAKVSGRTAKARLKAVKTDEGFVALTDLVVAAGLKADEVGRLVGQVNGQTSSAKQVALVKRLTETEFADRLKPGAHLEKTEKGRPMPPRARVGLLLGAVEKLLEDPDVVVRAYVPKERAGSAKKLRDAAKRLLDLAERMTEGEKVP